MNCLTVTVACDSCVMTYFEIKIMIWYQNVHNTIHNSVIMKPKSSSHVVNRYVTAFNCSLHSWRFISLDADTLNPSCMKRINVFCLSKTLYGHYCWAVINSNQLVIRISFSQIKKTISINKNCVLKKLTVTVVSLTRKCSGTSQCYGIHSC